MKVILSRKGFDGEAGKVPSPILPDGELCSLPIPSRDSRRLRDVHWRGAPLSDIVSDLTAGRLGRMTRIHLDPDLRRDAVPRLRGWRPTFGQVNAAQSHLNEQGVGPGDVFLFFGWFRQTVMLNGRLRYQPRSRHLHLLFGWLQVGHLIRLGDRQAAVPRWACDHPHVKRRRSMATNNTIYVASERLEIPGGRFTVPGAGVFPRFDEKLVLSAPGQRNRSLWQLPPWFFPRQGRTPLTYHVDASRWTRGRDRCMLQTVAVGQEFVFDTDEYPEAELWLQGLFSVLNC
jgi:hypothetical protein